MAQSSSRLAGGVRFRLSPGGILVATDQNEFPIQQDFANDWTLLSLAQGTQSRIVRILIQCQVRSGYEEAAGNGT